MEQLVARVISELGSLDVVVANAGIATWGRFWEMPVDRWRDMIDINLTGVFNTLRAAVPAMIEAGNGGSVVCISSVAGIKSLPGTAHYSAAKHGVVGPANSASIELAPSGSGCTPFIRGAWSPRWRRLGPKRGRTSSR